MKSTGANTQGNTLKRFKFFRISIYLITIISLYLFTQFSSAKISTINIYHFLFFSGLVALTETFTFIYNGVSFSTTFAVQLAAFIYFGPYVAIATALLGFSLRVLKMKNNSYKHIFNTPIYGTLVNYCLLILPIIYGGFSYEGVFGHYSNIESITWFNLYPILIFSIVFFIVNTLLISILSSIMTNKNLFSIFAHNIRLCILNILAMVPFGIILAVFFKMFSYLGVVIIFFPILLARYTFQLYADSKTKYVETVDAFMNAIEARDKYTEGHSKRVAEISTKIAEVLGYNKTKIEQLNIAALLHDVGKIGISDTILNKPGKLTDDEFNTIKTHSRIGYNILKDITNLDYASKIVLYHHERYDGFGYPDGKNHNDLELDIFIVQFADALDSMSSDRPYRKALTTDEILEEIQKNSSKQFHPKVVEAYLKLISQEKEVH